MPALTEVATEHLKGELAKRTAAEELQARLQPKIDAETRKHLTTFREVLLKNFTMPIAEWPEKDIEKIGTACRELGIATTTFDSILRELTQIEANKSILDTRATESERLWKVVTDAAEAMKKAEEAFRQSRIARNTAESERSVHSSTCINIEQRINALWIAYGGIDHAVARHRELRRANDGTVILPVRRQD